MKTAFELLSQNRDTNPIKLIAILSRETRKQQISDSAD